MDDGSLKRTSAVRRLLVVALVGIPMAAYAATISVPNTFLNGTIADADAVNANFDTLVTESNDQDSRISAVEGSLPHDCTLQTQSFPTFTNFAMFCGAGKLSLGGGGICLGGTLISAPYVAGNGSGWRVTCATVDPSNEVTASCCVL